MRCCLILATLLHMLLAAPLDASRPMVVVEHDGSDRRLEGLPLAVPGGGVALLGRDGRIWDLSQLNAKVRKTTNRFSSLTTQQFKSHLRGEFGTGFDVSGTRHFLVVHPTGQRDFWAPRFEDLYRSFFHYFAVRGVQPREPEFPLVAVVLANRREFELYAAREHQKLIRDMLGYYSRLTNRIVLYDLSEQRRDAVQWHQNATTLIHEATHQTAFNVGIHSRLGEQPRWLVEGLGMVFEAQGVWNSRVHHSRQDRVNQHRLADFRRYLKNGRPQGRMLSTISTDRDFQTAPINSYAEAWALTFYLLETRPGNYFRYLEKVSTVPDFQSYPQQARVADFQHAFGKNLKLLEAQFLSFMQKI